MYRFSSVTRLAGLPVRSFSSSSSNNARVTVIGAAGGIGQPLSLLLKLSPSITQLNLFDVVNVNGVAADVSHIETKATVKGFTGTDLLSKALEGTQIVLIPAGIPRKPGMTRDDLFSTNATIVYNIAAVAAKVCPDAFFGIITNPVNSTVPIAVEVFKHHGIDNWRRVFGITTLDIVRANTFLSENQGAETSRTNVPVIGGHSGDTIIPLLSQAHVGGQTNFKLSDGDREKLTKRIQNAGTEVVQAKAGAGSATLSMAFAANRFTSSLLKAINGRPDVVECAYVKNEKLGGQRIADVDFSYFAVPLLLGREGVAGTRFSGVAKLTAFEKKLLEKGTPELNANIAAGEKFAREKLKGK